MNVVTRVDDLRGLCREAREARLRVGLVPTMGALHAGHRSLLRAARGASDLVVLTVFVNPLQFGPDEDFSAYPRDLEADAEVAASEGVDVVFAPPVDEMYPGGSRTTVHVAGLTDVLCGASRPTHFDGVTTVLTKLFSIVGPSTAYFGRKDFQQLAVVRRLVADLDLPVEVVGCPLVRDHDGLALSSRNAYLSEARRESARAIPESLRAAAAAVEGGERSATAVEAEVRRVLARAPELRPEYVAVVDAAELRPVETLDGSTAVLVAVRVGSTRLIDNVVLDVTPGGSEADLGIVVPAEESESPCAAR
ncbi:MAG: pantoate--beta-alanine ligase [Acidimicrobiia bacterium]|nr:pantoate--beta-alanine ligase [Acidimicrobiia bacterium]MCL4291865.1 pantoate--beta-alanine ligase [Acidimicrobiia bacterium]